MTAAEVFIEAEKVRLAQSNRGPWRTAVTDYLVANGINKKSVHVDFESVSVHKSSNDGASGPLGHLGVCIWRIS